MFSKKTLLALVVIATAFYYGKWKKQRDTDHLEQAIIDTWNSLISKPQNPFRRVAVG